VYTLYDHNVGFDVTSISGMAHKFNANLSFNLSCQETWVQGQGQGRHIFEIGDLGSSDTVDIYYNLYIFYIFKIIIYMNFHFEINFNK